MIKSVGLARLYQAVRFGVVAFGAIVLGSPGAARAQQFSADIVVQRGAATTPAGRLRVLDGKLRIEALEFADGFFLADAAGPSAYFVRPGARIYMDARQSSQLTRLLVPVDPDAPCRQWQAMAHLAGLADNGDWRCERTGEEMILGRNTAVFHAVFGAGPAFFGWVDRERRIPLRIKSEDGTVIAVENIKDERPSPSSFELPPGFRKFSPEALVEKIKQSDVWVADQKDKPQP